jgi:hypothetical protein
MAVSSRKSDLGSLKYISFSYNIQVQEASHFNLQVQYNFHPRFNHTTQLNNPHTPYSSLHSLLKFQNNEALDLCCLPDGYGSLVSAVSSYVSQYSIPQLQPQHCRWEHNTDSRFTSIVQHVRHRNPVLFQGCC